MSLSPSRSAASYFLETIGKRVDARNRKRVALRVIDEASTVYLAWECVCYFSPTKEESHLGLISEAESKKCRRKVAERALSGFETEVPWKSYSDTFMGILLDIARVFGRKKSEEALSKIFQKNPQSVLDFLMACTGKAIPLQTGIPEPQDFETSHLRTLDKIFGKKKMFTLVKKQAGHLPKLKDRLSTLKLEGSDKIAAQFLFTYEKNEKEPTDTEPAPESDFEE